MARGIHHPCLVRERVGAEGFERACLSIAKDRAVKAEVGGLRSVDQAGGVIGAHLKENAQLEFTERLAAEKPVRIVGGVAGADDVESKRGSFADDLVELFAGVGGRLRVVEGNIEVVLVTQPFESLNAVDEHINRGRLGGVFRSSSPGKLIHQSNKGFAQLRVSRQSDPVRDGPDDSLGELPVP